MILADENIHSHIIKVLRDAQFKVISVQEISKGIKDQEIIHWALSRNLTILTEDKDFGEWVFAYHIKTVSVVFRRYSFEDYQKIAETLSFFCRHKN